MAEGSEPIVQVLQKVLNHLKSNPYPYVPNPEGCKRRASIAVVIRVRPAFTPIAAPNDSVIEVPNTNSSPSSIDEFFSQQWVQEGDAEVLFIKRAGREGDKWSGHVACPGGKRDPEDEDDIATAIRETREEVGLDLSRPDCLYAGNLAERVVAGRGETALMVLCPYIFVLTSKHVQPILPQPTEVASAHWVPLRALLSENLRTHEYVDFASRMVKPGGWVAQKLVRLIVGHMVLSAVQLAPAESIYASSIPGFLPDKQSSQSSSLTARILNVPSSDPALTHQQPLLLWGLTLGVLADLLDMLPPYNAVKLWQYPTFTPPELRFFIWLITRRLRRNNADHLSCGTWASQTATDVTTTAIAPTGTGPMKQTQANNKVGMEGSGLGSDPKYAMGRLLIGYYHRVNIAVGIFLAYRTVVGSAGIYWLYKLWRKRRFQ